MSALIQRRVEALADLASRSGVIVRTASIAVVVTFIGLSVVLAILPEGPGAGHRPTLMDQATVLEGLDRLGIAQDTYSAIHVLRTLVVSALLLALAAIIAWTGGGKRAPAVFSFTIAGFGWLLALDVLGGAPPEGGPLTAFSTLLYTSFFFAFYLFPDGRLVPRWTRWFLVAWILVAVTAAFPGSAVDPETWPPVLAAVLYAVMLLSCPASLALRYRSHADAVQRQQIKWVAFGLGTMVVAYVAFFLAPDFVDALTDPARLALYDIVGGSVLVLAYLAVPATVGIALTRWRLWDVDPIVGRILVYAGLTLTVIAFYVGVVGYLGGLLRVEDSLLLSLVATGIIAVVFAPLHNFFQARVNRILFGQRYEPYEAIVRLGRTLELTTSPRVALQTVVDTLRECLNLPYAAVEVVGDRGPVTRVEAGDPSGDEATFPLRFGGERVGTLTLSSRAPGTGFSRPETALLDDLARQVGAVAHAERLSSQLHEARTALVEAREEERRWISQELHDGLGPLLASQGLNIAAAQQALADNPRLASDILGDAIGHAQSAVDDVRRIVRGLRPPTLDSLGLSAALESLAVEFSQAGPTVFVRLPEATPRLPAAVEVACFRIAQEALTNAVRHAGATRCELRVSVGEHVRLSVTDDGLGISPSAIPGLGIASMRARAEELGGSFRIHPGPGRGTVVEAVLPIGGSR
jgi:signal transduction histidine kinase